MELTVAQVAALIDGAVEGNDQVKINRLEKIEEATAGSIAFLANPKYTSHIYNTRASAVIVSAAFEPQDEISSALIRVKDPYVSFSKLLSEYEKLTKKEKTGIEKPSFQSPDAQIGPGVYLGAFSYIGSQAKIGKGAKIYPHAFIGDGVEIGENTVVHTGVKVYANCKIGNHCSIHAGTVIGSDGFGFAPQDDGTYQAIPQIGSVIIEDHVDIGANTVIDRATMGATIIKSGVKLDNLIQLAHNVEIGRDTVIAAQAGVSGSTKIGENCVIAGQVGVVGHLTIADKTKIGAQSGVPKDIKEEGKIVSGSPAVDHKDFLKINAVLRNLVQLQERVKELEKNTKFGDSSKP